MFKKQEILVFIVKKIFVIPSNSSRTKRGQGEKKAKRFIS